jgi:hypothetical protein
MLPYFIGNRYGSYGYDIDLFRWREILKTALTKGHPGQLKFR